MSQENVETVRRLVEGSPRSSPYDVLGPHVEFDARSSPGPYAAIYRGHEGVKRFMEDWMASWADYSAEVEELVDAGDEVAGVVVERGRGRETGIEVENRVGFVWTLRGGKVIRMKRYATRAEALEAVGLRE
jgi:ketosteroid isomerase-like protein